MATIGKAWVGVSPVLPPDFKSRAQADISAALKRVDANVSLGIDDKKAQADLLKVKAQLLDLSKKTAKPNISVSGALKADAAILTIQAGLDKLDASNALGNVGKSAAGAAPGLAALQTPMGALIAAGVVLSPVLVTVAAGMGGLGIAAFATISPILKAAGATGGLKANMATLSPVQQQMAKELLALESTASGFAKSLQPEIVTLWGDAIGIAGSLLKDVQPVAKATGDALHGVLAAINASLQTGQWRQFFAFMAATAGPDVQLLGKVLTDLLNDLPPLIEGFQPLAMALLIIVDDALKVVGALGRFQLLLPVIGAAIGFLVGGPIGALIGGLAGVAVQGLAAAEAAGKFAGSVQNLSKLPVVTRSMVGFAGVAGQVAASMTSTAGATQAVQAAMAQAHPVVGTLAGDLAVLDSHIHDATLKLQAFDDQWRLLVGASVSDQQAVLNLAQAFDSYTSAVKQSGRTSVAAQQAFLSIFDTVKNGLDALVQNGASVDQLNSFYQTSIDKLNALHGLTPQQRKDVQGLTQDYAAWASTVAGLSGNLVTAAGDISSDFLSAMGGLHKLVPQAGADVQGLANSILKTGDNSRATAIDRAQLIKDLEHSGVTAKNAAALVNAFQGQIDQLHGKSVNVGLTTSGKGQIIITGTGITQRVINTTTGQLNATGGHTIAKGAYIATGAGPSIDDFPALLARGELVVPAHLVSSGAVDHLRGRIPGFAAGGLVGKAAGAESGIATAEAQWGQLAASAFAQAAVQAALKAQQAAAAAAGFTPGAPATGSAAAAQAFALSILPAGWSWPDLQALWQRESGWNANAVNPSSGAYGIPQSLGHGHPYNLGDYANQVRWGISYIAGRYGNSQGAWAHETSFGWYDRGGVLPPWGVGVNTSGKPEMVTPATGPGSLHETNALLLRVSQQLDHLTRVTATTGPQVGHAVGAAINSGLSVAAIRGTGRG